MNRQSQRGMALVVALIMLGLMTAVCLASFNIGRTGMDVVANMQRRNEVTASANSAIEQALSSKRLFQSPGELFATPCNGVNNSLCYDLNGDGTNDVVVTISPVPSCIQSQTIPTAVLSLGDDQDKACTKGIGRGTSGIEGIPSGDSFCANTMWEMNAQAVDAVTSAAISVTEGAAVRVSVNDVTTSCP